jgi:hypothetical protein
VNGQRYAYWDTLIGIRLLGIRLCGRFSSNPGVVVVVVVAAVVVNDFEWAAKDEPH